MSWGKSGKRSGQRYQARFEAMIRERERIGLSLEKMAELLGEMAEVDDDKWRPVTAQELSDAERDPLHGLSLPALMYARFMGCVPTISRNPGSVHFNNDDFIERMMGKRVPVKAEPQQAIGVMMGDGCPMSLWAHGIDGDGAVIRASASFKHMTQEEQQQVLSIMRSADERAQARIRGDAAAEVMRERYRMFADAKKKRKAAKRAVREMIEPDGAGAA